MKRIISSLLFCCLFQILSSQTNVPQILNFQAVAIDNQGNPLANSSVLIRVTVRQGGATGDPIFCGLHTLITDAFGTFSFRMNQNYLGNNCNGAATSFENIPWELGQFWLEVEYSYDNGQNYTVISPIEIASVPYAFQARKVERISTDGALEGQVLKFNSLKNRFEPGADNFQGGGGSDFFQQNPGLKPFENRLAIGGVFNLTDGESYISFPEKIAAFCAQHKATYQYTVTLTPHSAESKGLAVIEKNEGGFKIKELQSGIGNYGFDWEVKIMLLETPNTEVEVSSTTEDAGQK